MIYDEEENRILIWQGTKLADEIPEAREADIPGRNTGGCHRRRDSGQLRPGFPVGGRKAGTVEKKLEGPSAGADGSAPARIKE